MKPLLLLLALPVAAHASWFEFEAGVGMTHYETENGRWYQNGQPENTVHANAPAISVGITAPFYVGGNRGVDWHLDYVRLGNASASCTCLTRDSDYAAHRDGPRARFSGSGNARGVSLTVEPYYWTHGWRFGLEAGVFVYRSTWRETVTGWTVSDAPVQNLQLSASGWHVAPVAGVNAGDGVWSVSYRHYFMRYNSVRQNVPPLWSDADVLEIKRRF